MIYRDLQEEFLAEMGRRSAPLGYVHKKRTQDFVRPFPGGRQAFHVSFIKLGTRLDLTVDVAVRFDALEDLVNGPIERLSKRGKRENKQTYSMGVELGNLSQGRPKQWTIRTSDDIPAAAAGAVEYFKAVGLPYLEKYSEMEEAYELLSRDNKIAGLLGTFRVKQAEGAIGLAKLLHKPDIDQLIQRKREYLLSVAAHPTEFSDFERFVEYIKSKKTPR